MFCLIHIFFKIFSFYSLSHFRKPSDFDLEFGNILFNFFYAVCQLMIFFCSWESLSTIYVDFSIFLNKKKIKMKNSHGIRRLQNLLTHYYYYYYYYLFIIIIIFYYYIYLFVFIINLLFYVF